MIVPFNDVFDLAHAFVERHKVELAEHLARRPSSDWLGRAVSRQDIVLPLEDKPDFVPVGLAVGLAAEPAAEFAEGPAWPGARFVPCADGD